MKKTYLIFIYLISLFLFSCNSKEEIEKTPATGDYYDPSKPVSVEKLSPTWGIIDQTFVVKGNFPKDTAQIKVYFSGRKAVVLGCDGNEIFGMIPKQLPGYNQLSVVVGKDSLVPDIKFKYYQTASVKTVVGKFDEDKYLEGSLDEARIVFSTGVGTVKGQKGDNIILVEGEWQDRVSLVSLDDNKMIKLAGVGWIGGPAITSTRDKFYVINREGNRTIYSFAREDGWTPNTTGIVISNNDLAGNIIGGLAFAEDDRYLYVMSGEGHMISVDLEEKTYKRILTNNDWDGVNVGAGWWSYLIYSKYHKCFFASFQDANGIFKITQDAGGNWKAVKYAGFNGGNVALGHRLNDAVLRNPVGMTVNQEGDIYVVSRGGHCILKISGDIVSLVAGTPNVEGTINGNPLESRFKEPLSITTDFEDNFYIGGGRDRVIRKLTIE